MVSKPKDYSSKKYQKVYDIISPKKKILRSIDRKYVKWKPNEKLSIKCKHIGEGSYMFIFTSEIGCLTSY